jgi:amino acid transporter
MAFFLVQTASIGALGLDGIAEHAASPMLYLAEIVLGPVGAVIAMVMLLAAMVLIVQTSLLGSANALASIAEEGNIQGFFGKTNKYGAPFVAMISVSALNILLVGIGGSASAVLAGSSISYVLANGIALFSYVKAHKTFKTQTRVSEEEIFHAPKGWIGVSIVLGFVQIPVFIAGLVYLILTQYHFSDLLIGVGIILMFVPLWLLARATNLKAMKRKASGVQAADNS